MAAEVPLKLVQLIAIPALLIGGSLFITPRRPQPGLGASSHVAAGPASTFFSGGAEPARAIDLAAVPAAIAREAPEGWFQVTVISGHADAAAAESAAVALRAVLVEATRHLADPDNAKARERRDDDRSPAPLTPPEARAFDRHGVQSPIGVGAAVTSGDAAGVLVLGPLVLVSDLKADFAGLQPNPLAALMAKLGDRVLVEGDPAAPHPPLIDIAGRAPDETTARRLADACAQYLALPPALLVRAPWDPAGVSPAEARARVTFAAAQRAVREASGRPQDMFEPYLDVDTQEEAQVHMQRLSEAMRERARAAIDALPAAEHDEVVLAEHRRALTEPASLFQTLDFDLQARERLAARMGGVPSRIAVGAAGPVVVPQLEPAPGALCLSAAGKVRCTEGTRLELAGLRFQRIARGLPALLAWLRQAGLRDVRLNLSAAPALRR